MVAVCTATHSFAALAACCAAVRGREIASEGVGEVLRALGFGRCEMAAEPADEANTLVDVKACKTGGGLCMPVSARRAMRAVGGLRERSRTASPIGFAVLDGVANAARERRVADACARACRTSVGMGQRGFNAVGRERAVVCLSSSVT